MRFRALAGSVALLTLVGCQDDAPVGPTTSDFQAARQEMAAKLAKGKPKAPKKVAPAGPAPEPAENSFGAIGINFTYDSTGKRDPFRSFEWEQLKMELLSADAEGPLEKFDVMQLSVVGVVWKHQSARALVQDPSGMTYIVGEGAKIGKNEGRVTQIADNLVVVKETYVDTLGEETTKDIQMRIRITEGG